MNIILYIVCAGIIAIAIDTAICYIAHILTYGPPRR